MVITVTKIERQAITLTLGLVRSQTVRHRITIMPCGNL